MTYGADKAKYEWIAKLKAEGKYKGKAEPLEPEPSLSWHLHWIWQGFCILSEKRLANETGPQPIQISEISAYLDLNGMTDEYSVDMFLNHVSSLDREYLKHAFKKREEQMKKMQKKAESSSRRG